jgi:hypothetical protein
MFIIFLVVQIKMIVCLMCKYAYSGLVSVPDYYGNGVEKKGSPAFQKPLGVVERAHICNP